MGHEHVHSALTDATAICWLDLCYPFLIAKVHS